MIVESLLIGLIVGFIFYELTGITSGGIITPGYFALFIFQPEKIFTTIILALIVWGILNFSSRNFILYGKRKFLFAILLGFFIKLLFEYLISSNIINVDLYSIGYIIPGLIANEMTKQGLVKTLSSTIIVTSLVFLIIMLIR